MVYQQIWRGSRVDPQGDQYYPDFPAEVPGNIQYDYNLATENIDIQYSDNVLKFIETENYWWEYHTVLDFSSAENESVWFVAEGIDYTCDILLDGQQIGSHTGMFSRIEIELTGRAKIGSILKIMIHPHPNRGGDYSKLRQVADQSCKPPVVYGWDFNPRLMISGLWKPAYIETRDDGYIGHCEPRYILNDSLDTARISFETECLRPVVYTLTDRDGKVLYRGTDSSFTVENIQLWWCNGQGDPYLYHWTAESCSCKKSGRIGFRRVRLVQNIGTNSEPRNFPMTCYSAAITVELNGRRIFAKGSNLVNPDIFFGRVQKQRYKDLIEMAYKANMNILRLWGGAGIQKDEFYQLCDEYGIMIWQEFMLACNNYTGTSEYLTILEQEAISIIKNLRHHACLSIWCGGNELFNRWSGMNEQSEALRLLNSLCYIHDCDHPFIMTSPLNGMAHGGYFFENEQFDVFQEYANSHNTAYSEFGVPAIADCEILKEIIPKDELFPIMPTKSWIAHHAFDAWGSNSWSNLNTLERYFGKLTSLEKTVHHSQWLQAVGYQVIFEEARRQWPYCSMALNWCLNEPWITAANNSLISYPLRPKAAYDSVKAALRPVLASARIPKFDWKSDEKFTAELWYLNDSDETVSDTVQASLIFKDESYDLFTWNVSDVKPRSNQYGPSINIKLPIIFDVEEFVLDLKAGDGRSSRYRLAYKTHIPKPPSCDLNKAE